MTHISGPPFATVQLREGYKAAEVDALVGEVVPSLERHAPDAEIAHRIMNATFTPVRLRGGYEMGEVDAYLDGLVEWAFTGRRPA